MNNKEIILKLADRIKELYKPEKIILYGSFAYGHPDENSDIDFLIIKDTNESFINRLVAVRKIVSDLRRGYAFSPVVLTPKELQNRQEIGDQITEEILSRGEIIYAR